MKTLRVVSQQHQHPRLSSPLAIMLWVLFLGPLIAPLFQASALPLLADSGSLARTLLAGYVCPTPAKSYLLLGLPMAVCARCWGATIGLWIAYLLVRPRTSCTRYPAAWFFRRTPGVRLILALGTLLLWPLEIYGEAMGWWYAPYWLLLVNGALFGSMGGLLLASLFCPNWDAQ